MVPILLEEIDHWTYAKLSHWKHFSGLDLELYGETVDPETCRLKSYQDLLIMMLINELIPPGSKILEVGGGGSRILQHFATSHECWNIDKFEGLGNGPESIGQVPYKVVVDYMGNFNQQLPNDYFDIVFSISALEHVEEVSEYEPICEDINRVLRKGGLSAHLLDVIFGFDGSFWTNKIANFMFESQHTLNQYSPPELARADPDLFLMSEHAYIERWQKFTGKSYEEHGGPSSLNIFWRKN